MSAGGACGYGLCKLCEELGQILKAGGNALNAVLVSLILNGEIAVIARSFENGDALLDGDIAHADSNAAQVVATARLEASARDGTLGEGALYKVFGMCVEGIGCNARNGDCRICDQRKV